MGLGEGIIEGLEEGIGVVGNADGLGDGRAVGTIGSCVGLGDGIIEGLGDGTGVVGRSDGAGVGTIDGAGLGKGLGINDGLGLGSLLGEPVPGHSTHVNVITEEDEDPSSPAP